MVRSVARVWFPVVPILCCTATTAAAQATREEWVALRDRKQARQSLAASPTALGALTLTAIRFYSDSSGRLVGVGEARNDSGLPLTYARLEFAFYNATGGLIGAELTYLHGGRNARIVAHGLYESVLDPGTTGFFKVWTTIPASSMSSYTVASSGADLAFAPPLASLHSGPEAQTWDPMVFMFRRPVLAGQRVTDSVVNEDPLGSGSGLHRILTYAVRVSVAAYQDGVITDVQTTLATGPRTVAPCDEPARTGMSLHESASFTIDLQRPANSLGTVAIEWEEMGVVPQFFTIPDGSGASHRFTVARKCGWTAVPTEPWISVIDGAASDRHMGTVTFAVQPNTTGTSRSGRIDVSGMTVDISQAPRCNYAVSPAALFLGPGTVNLTEAVVSFSSSNCPGTGSPVSSASWLRVPPGYPPDAQRLSVVQPNLTGATRSATVTVGNATLTVYQSTGSRNTEFNNDGRLDLLWHHEGDGRVSTWLMNGTQIIDGTLLTPGQVPDTNWKPVGAGDFDRNGTTDIVWQHAADGRLSFWRMSGTRLLDGRPLSPSQVADTGWKIRAMADFNLDGDPDLVWQHEGDGRVAVWLMQLQGGTPTRISGDPLGPGQVPDTNWKIVGSGDFNGDVWPDLVWQHQGDGRISVWKMRGTALVDGDLITPGQIADLDWKIRGVGDIDGNDRPDLIWQHRVSGHVSVWLMNGTTMVSGIGIGQVPDTSWHIVSPR